MFEFSSPVVPSNDSHPSHSGAVGFAAAVGTLDDAVQLNCNSTLAIRLFLDQNVQVAFLALYYLKLYIIHLLSQSQFTV